VVALFNNSVSFLFLARNKLWTIDAFFSFSYSGSSLSVLSIDSDKNASTIFNKKKETIMTSKMEKG